MPIKIKKNAKPIIKLLIAKKKTKNLKVNYKTYDDKENKKLN